MPSAEAHGRHSLKVGGEFKRSRYGQWGEWQTRGSWSFGGSLTGDNLADYLLGLPSEYRQRSPYNYQLRTHTLVAYVQDDFKFTPRLSLNLGFRYEYHNNPSERNDKYQFLVPQSFYTGTRSAVYPNMPPGMLYAGDAGMPVNAGFNRYRTLGVLGPRFGFAYDIFGDGKTTFRGAFGLFNIPIDLEAAADCTQNPPFDMLSVVSYPASYGNPFLGRVDPFPSWKPKIWTNLIDVSTLFPIVTWPNSLTYRNGYVEQWNFSLERQVRSDMKISLTYVGQHSLHLLSWPQVNAAKYIPGVDANGNPLSTRQNTNSRRSYAPYWASMNLFGSDASLKSNALQVVVEKRLSHGFTISANYALSNTMSWLWNHASNHTQDSTNLFGDYARAENDVHHRAIGSWIWILPKFTTQPLAAALVNGWELTGIATLQGGMPINLVTGVDNSLTGNGQDRPNVVGDWHMPGGRSEDEVLAQYFNTKAFVPNSTGQFGNLGFNALRGRRLVNFDLGIFRNFRVKEKHTVQFRAEGFNADNHTKFGAPNTNLSSATYGRTTSASGARIVQFGLKYSF